MARKSGGAEALERARKAAITAKTADELRVALAVTLPLDASLSIAQAAAVLGRSAKWISRARSAFINDPTSAVPPAGRGGRRHALLSLDDEELLVKLAVILSVWDLPPHKRPEVRDKLLELLWERGLNPSPTTVTSLLRRVSLRLFPDQKAEFVVQNRDALTRLWWRKLPRDLRLKHGLVFPRLS